MTYAEWRTVWQDANVTLIDGGARDLYVERGDEHGDGGEAQEHRPVNDNTAPG